MRSVGKVNAKVARWYVGLTQSMMELTSYQRQTFNFWQACCGDSGISCPEVAFIVLAYRYNIADTKTFKYIHEHINSGNARKYMRKYKKMYVDKAVILAFVEWRENRIGATDDIRS